MLIIVLRSIRIGKNLKIFEDAEYAMDASVDKGINPGED